MKKSASIFFVLAMLIYSCNNFFTYFAFQLNQKNIIQTHCENTAKPKMHCDGKCYLKKQVDKENNTKKPVNSVKEKIEVLFFSAISSLIFPVICKKIKNLFFYREMYYPEVFYSIVHPPA
jgi:hypothetical protein